MPAPDALVGVQQRSHPVRGGASGCPARGHPVVIGVSVRSAIVRVTNAIMVGKSSTSETANSSAPSSGIVHGLFGVAVGPAEPRPAARRRRPRSSPGLFHLVGVGDAGVLEEVPHRLLGQLGRVGDDPAVQVGQPDVLRLPSSRSASSPSSRQHFTRQPEASSSRTTSARNSNG